MYKFYSSELDEVMARILPLSLLND